ncbi:hypothetical protein MTX26_30685 [Bradyrhizobium sp. ISRA443]|uniref:AI-2E family transporter n=1 Tax=unclassified Bradyrhizobium TaxID=2631580 RepID=UPI0024799222|nr:MULTISPECIES: hypothetical protein [unclassified Bradyrhizobium]WGR93924.1 hypothetical protein MTX20_05675 [Bradyrhizobium sp. ISRA435]WGR98544.1 hypothetical protein MTX23_30670 [Bradyrhizobium sp. ISRA436]WGS05433.1 hypothetical protein MTX18_30690 [Bradyrhizobium sp. ISRA437]WGS12319.1 hypothetical protein MTX26_30685 [Bradyrhizobium sp. ISRA443]
MNQRALRTRPEADHEHVSRISTGMILFIISATALAVYELQLALIPFVVAAVVSYICAPAIGWVSARAHLPRLPVSIAAFLVILAFGAVIGWLGIPLLAREMTHTATDLQGMLNHLTEALVDGNTVNVLGQPMDSRKLAAAVGPGRPRLDRQCASAFGYCGKRLCSRVRLPASAGSVVLLHG